MKINNNGKYKIVPASYLILIKKNRVLLARRCHTGFEDGNYGLPAGHGEENESAKQTLQREIKEELGIDIRISDMQIAHVMHRKGKNDERVDFFFTVKKYKGELKNMEPEKCDDLRWFPIDNLPKNTIDYIQQVIKCYKKGIFYSEFGWGKK